MTGRHCGRTTQRLTDLGFLSCVRYEHVCTYVRVHAACTVNSEVYLFNTSRKKKEIFLTVTEKFLPVLTPILLASETIFREQTGSPVPCEVS